MSAALQLNANISCYLTPEAKLAMATITGLGVDADLALACLEHMCDEETIYSLAEPIKESSNGPASMAE